MPGFAKGEKVRVRYSDTSWYVAQRMILMMATDTKFAGIRLTQTYSQLGPPRRILSSG
jgi:hypothetical protein